MPALYDRSPEFQQEMSITPRQNGLFAQNGQRKSGSTNITPRYIDTIYYFLMLAISILGLLKQQPMHGYEIRKQLSELLSLSTAISYGSLYPALAKLHRQGLIETSSEPKPRINKIKEQVFSTGSLTGDLATIKKSSLFKSAKSSKNKKVYSITEKGEKYFTEKLLVSFVKNAKDSKAFKVHLAFFSYLTEEQKHLFIKNRISALEEFLNSIPITENHELKLFNDVERQYIHDQIKFLETLQKDL